MPFEPPGFPPLPPDVVDALDSDFGDPLAQIGEALVAILRASHEYQGAASSDDIALRAGAAHVLGAAVLALAHLRALTQAVADEITGGPLGDALDYGLVLRYDGEAWRLSRSRSGTRYDNDLLTSRIAAALADDAVQKLLDKETGEMPPPAAIAQYVVEAMVAATGAGTASFASWRKKPLQALGINVGKYEIEGGGRGPLRLTPLR